MDPGLSEYVLAGDNSMYADERGLVVPVVTRAGSEPDDTGQSAGARRVSGVSIQHTPATKLWFGQVHNLAGYRSGPHHHGELDRLVRLRSAVSAGEHIPLQTWQKVHDGTGLKVIDGIGATEMLHIFISAAGDDIRPGATGKPVPGYRATVLDSAGREVGPGIEGRLGVIGPVGCRYLDNDRQRGYVVNGWNVTGDTFVHDEEG